MKKWIKWLAIFFGFVLLFLVAFILIFFISHNRFGLIPSGGELSPNQAAYDIGYYELNLRILPAQKSISGSAVIVLQPLETGLSRIELDLVDNFTVHSVHTVHPAISSYQHEDDKLILSFTNALQSGKPLAIRVDYSGQPVEAIRPPWVGGFNWSKTRDGQDWIGLSCQGEGAKIWFPCKDHPSDEADSVRLNITVPKHLFCAANGILENVSTADSNWTTYHWITRYPINNYNINIGIGPYWEAESLYQTESGSEMPVVFYHLPQSAGKAAAHLAMAVDMLQTYRKFYGEYPFTREKFGLVETDYLGMEHQTLNAYGNFFRYDTLDGIVYDWLMLHEMGHEWWGNQLTGADWADLWLHEGICTYGEALYLQEKGGMEAYHRHVRKFARRISNKKPVLPERPANSTKAYQGDIYFKGAMLMHSLRFMMGDSLFFTFLKDFATNPQYIMPNFAETGDFLNLLKKYGQDEAARFCNIFLTGTELPEFKIISESPGRFGLSVDYNGLNLPVEISYDGQTRRQILGPQPTVIESAVKPVVDPRHWYLTAAWLDSVKGREQ